MRYTIHQAKTQLSRLIAAALEGQEVVIARGSQPVVKLTPLAAGPRKRTFGAFRGEFELTDAFFEPLPKEETAAWIGERV